MRSSAFGLGYTGWPRFRRSLALALLLAVVLASSAQAQGTPKSYKRYYLALGGFLLVGIPAYVFTAEGGLNTECSSKSCVGLMAGLIGATIGFLVGLEMDNNFYRRMAAGPSLDYTFQDVPLDLTPDRITGFPGGAAVVGLGGARVIFVDGSVRPRAVGVRGIEDVAVLPELDLLVLSTFSNLLSFSVRNDTAQGQVIDESGGGAMEVFQSRLAVAGLDSLRLLRLKREAGDVSVETAAGFQSFDYVTDMAAGGAGRVGWVLSEDRLTAYDQDLEKIGEAFLPAAGRTVRADGGRLAVAAGSNGVFVLDATDPRATAVVQQYTGVRFAYAADLDGDLLYVAAGSEGVAVVNIAGETPAVVGVARHTTFASDVVVSGRGKVWILDRDGRSVQMADFRVEQSAEDASASR